MKRREFTKLASLSAVAVSTTGFILFNGKSYGGDCETTTDILGPFYRPDSPIRNNLIIDGALGGVVELTGIVRHKDCQTPYKNAKVELWHCSAEGIYDNKSSEFKYRGTTFCDNEGKYKFTTQMPVPYDVGTVDVRPAHFHLFISAPGYQSLITQIYFTGDPYLEIDAFSASNRAESRILDVIEKNGIRKVTFDCNMNDKLKVSYSALDKIVGLYKNDNTGESMELFNKDNLLWQKNNEAFGWKYDYVGDNEFEYGGLPTGWLAKLRFDLQNNGQVKLTETSVWDGIKTKNVFTKVKEF